MLNWKDRITINPDQCGGKPCIRGMRIRVVDILDLLSAGYSQEEVLKELPDLEKDDVHAALRYAIETITNSSGQKNWKLRDFKGAYDNDPGKLKKDAYEND